MAVATGVALVPKRAAAVDNLEYIIPAALGGVLAVILIIAVLMADKEKEELYLVDGPLPDERPPALRVGPACASPSTGMPLLCW